MNVYCDDSCECADRISTLKGSLQCLRAQIQARTLPSVSTQIRTMEEGCKLKVGKTHGSCFATTCPSPLSPRRGRRAKTCCIIMWMVDHLRPNCSQLPSILSSDTPSSVTSSHFSGGFFQGDHFRLYETDNTSAWSSELLLCKHCKCPYRPKHCLL